MLRSTLGFRETFSDDIDDEQPNFFERYKTAIYALAAGLLALALLKGLRD